MKKGIPRLIKKLRKLEKENNMTQKDYVLQHLNEGKTITPLEALRLYGSFRLGAIIFDLKADGHNIVNDWEESNGKRYAKYRLVPKERLL